MFETPSKNILPVLMPQFRQKTTLTMELLIRSKRFCDTQERPIFDRFSFFIFVIDCINLLMYHCSLLLCHAQFLLS